MHAIRPRQPANGHRLSAAGRPGRLEFSPVEPVIIEGEVDVVDLPVRPDDDAGEMIRDDGERAGRLSILSGRVAGKGALADEGLGIELAAADPRIDPLAGKIEGDIVEPGPA